MARMRDTNVFKSVAPYIKSLTKTQLEREMVLAREECRDFSGFCEEQNTLSMCFIWAGTSRGHRFWSNLSREFFDAQEKGVKNVPNN